MHVALRVYKVLLLAYPAAFRQHFGDEMALVFRDCCVDALRENGYLGLLRFWLRTLFDLGLTILMEHIDSLTRKADPLMSTALFDQQLVSTFDLMSRMLRSGYSVLQTLQHIANTAPEPTASHIRAMLADIQAGANWFAALEKLQTRINSVHLQEIVAVMTQQLQEGGNLADRLDTKLTEMRPQSGDDGWSDNVPLNLE